MKKLLLIFSTLVFLFSACSKEDTPPFFSTDKGTTPFSFTTAASEQQFKISSNTNWKVVSSASWCKVSPASGSGDATIKVNAEENTALASRTAKITITADGIEPSTVIDVSQSGVAPSFVIVNALKGFTIPGGKDTLIINSNVNWTVTQDNDSKAWCTLSATSGSAGNDQKLIITAVANNNPNARKATLTFNADQITTPVVKDVNQLGENPELSVTPTTLAIPGGEAKQVTLSVTSNLAYTVSINASWITQVPGPTSKTIATNTLTFDIAANTTLAERKGKVTFTKDSYTATFEVTQGSLAAAVSADSTALVDIFNKSNAVAAWSNSIKENWLTGPLKTWKGVHVDPVSGRVDGLTLGIIASWASGCTPAALTADMDFSDLSELKSLSVALRQGSPIPVSLGTLANLQRLIIKSTIMSGVEDATIPVELYNCKNLQYLDISSFSFSYSNTTYYFVKGALDSKIEQLTKLDTLILIGNRITSIAPISKLTTLKMLSIKNNCASITLPEDIDNLKDLTNLTISMANLTGTIPAGLCNLTKLTNLDLSVNVFAGSATIPANIGNLTKLTSLNLAAAQLTGNVPSSIGNLTELKTLNLNNNIYLGISVGLYGSLPASIGNLTALTSLNLSGNAFTGALPGSMGNLVNLTSLGVTKNQFTKIEAGFGNIGSANLTNLDFSDNVLNSVETDFPKAQILNFTNNKLIYTSFAPMVSANNTKLTNLVFTNNLLSCIPTGLLNVSSISLINLTSNPLDVSAINTNNATGSLPNMKSLTISGTAAAPLNITSIPTGFATLMPNLNSLVLNFCKINAATGIPAGVNAYTNLWSLTLQDNQLTTMPANLSAFPALRVVDLSNEQSYGTPRNPATCNKISSVSADIASVFGFTLAGATAPTGAPSSMLNLTTNVLESFPAALASLPGLVVLDLSNNQMTGTIPNLTMPNLMTLNLYNNKLTGSIPATLASLVKVQMINLSGNKLTGVIPDIFGTGKIPTGAFGSGKLNTFNVSGNQLGGNTATLSWDPAFLLAGDLDPNSPSYIAFKAIAAKTMNGQYQVGTTTPQSPQPYPITWP